MTTCAAISLTAPAFVLGFGLIILPIVAHLLNRKATKRITFPSIEFLVAASASQSSLFKLRRWWLLLLRCLAVSAIVLAFTQPVWRSAEAQRVAGIGAALVLVVDTSASTGQLHNGIPAFRSMHAEADRVLSTLTPGIDHANIVYAAAHPYSALASMTTHTDTLRLELAEHEPTYERADMLGALSLAGRLLDDHDGPRHLVITSDLQESNWEEALRQFQLSSVIPEDTRITVTPLHRPPPTNLSLHSPTARPVSPRTGQPLQLSVNLTNHSDRVQPATVRMSINGRPTASQSLTLEPRQQKEVSFTATLDHTGQHRVIFSLPADGLAIDDRCYLAVAAVDRTPVVLLTGGDPNHLGTAGYFMARALAPYGDDRDRYETRLVHTAQLLADSLRDAAVVFADQTGLLGSHNLRALLHYIEQGGQLVFFCGDASAAQNLSAMDQLKPDQVLPWRPVVLQEWRNPAEIMTITGGDWGSPLLSHFNEDAQLALAEVRFHRTWSGNDVDPNAHLLLQYADGTPALTWRQVGAGRLINANFSAAESYSDLGKHGLFVAMMQGLADTMHHAHQSEVNHTVGRAATLTTTVPVDRSGPAPRVYQPDGLTPTDVTLSLGDRVSDIIISNPSRPGFYTAQQGDVVLGTSAINPDPRESDLKRISPEELIACLRFNEKDPETQTTEPGQPLTSQGRDLWGWLVLLACICLGSELFLLGHWRR